MELALRRCTFETCADSIDPYGYAPLSAPPARQAAQPCEPAMVSKAEHIVVLPHKCPAVPDHPSDTLLHMPRHHVTVPAKLAQMQSHQIRHRANDVGQIFLQPPHMHLMALGAAVQLRGLHAHIVKSSMHTHTHVLMRLRHALTGAAPAGREAADASVFGCTAAGTACKSKSWLEVSNQNLLTRF